MTSYAIIRAGAVVSIHDEPLIADGFGSVTEANDYIREQGLTRVQIVAVVLSRRWLTTAEQAELNHALVRNPAPLPGGLAA